MSLLTQFYPGPGGDSGGGGFSNATGSSPSLVLGGYTGNVLPSPAPSGWGLSGIGVYSPTTTTYSAGYAPSSAGNSPYYSDLAINNTGLSYTGSVSVPIKKITLNGAALAFGPSTAHTSLTAIAGSGLLSMYLNSIVSPQLTSISTDITISGSGPFRILGAKLDATSVNHILTNLVANGYDTNPSGWTLDLSGGTSAGVGALTPAGAAARAALIAGGWAVNLNL